MLLTHRIGGSISDRRSPITQMLPKTILRISLAGRGPDFDESDAGIGTINRYTPARGINHKKLSQANKLNRIQIINLPGGDKRGEETARSIPIAKRKSSSVKQNNKTNDDAAASISASTRCSCK